MAVNPIPSILVITIVGILSSVAQGQDVIDDIWPEELFVPFERSLDYISFPEVTWHDEDCSGFFEAFICGGKVIVSGIVFIGTIVFNFFAFITKVTVFLINTIFVMFAFINLLIGWMTFNIPGAPGWARVLFSVVVTGPLVVSIYQHLRGN